MYWSAEYNRLFQPSKHITSIDLVQQCLCQFSILGTPCQDSSCCLLLDISFSCSGFRDACSQFFCYNTSKQDLFVDAEAFEDFSEAFDCSGFNWQLFCWHSRENWTKIYPSVAFSRLMTLLYIVLQFVNIRSLRDWYSIYQISDFRHGAKYKFSLGTTCKRVNLYRSWL